MSLAIPMSASEKTRFTVQKNLCNFCMDTIITTDIKWGLHHSSAESLQDSAAQGCTFCCQLFTDIRLRNTKITATLYWPRYEWDIQGPQRRPDSEDDAYAAVVFHEVVADEYSDDPVCQLFGLPTRKFFLFEQSDLARMQSQGPLGTDTFSIESQQTMKEWIEECDMNHPDCAGRADKGFMPTRLLDLNYQENSVLVVDTHRDCVQAPYTTLSYSWGKKPFVNLSPDNIIQFMESGLTINSLPRTIREAIQTTRMLGVRYIWVDSLCIMQGEDGDFQFEASLMLQVYRNSMVNLAASDSNSADDGLFRSRTLDDLTDTKIQGRSDSKILGTTIWRIVPRAFWDDQVQQAQLNNRGWVFQERLLSPRILHFSNKQIFWDCATVRACETFRNGLPSLLDTGIDDRYWRRMLQKASNPDTFVSAKYNQILVDFWRNAIRTYSRCQLTDNRDKLVAIWGIVRFLIQALKQCYAVGLWERNLEEQLAWYVVDCATSKRQTYLDAPSWSWASVDGEIELPRLFDLQRQYRVRDHHGQRIAFDLDGLSRGGDQRGSRTWNEQLQQYQTRLQEIEDYRRNSTMASPRMKSHAAINLDPIPQLRTHSLAMRTHIGEMAFHKSFRDPYWARDVSLGFVRAYPDFDPGEKFRSLFIVLTVSEWPPDVPDGSYVRLPPGSDHEGSGVGLLIDYGDSPAHFVRRGVIHFGGVLPSMFYEDFIDSDSAPKPELLGEYDREKGFKIWLD